jgi:hypothetical protein
MKRAVSTSGIGTGWRGLTGIKSKSTDNLLFMQIAFFSPAPDFVLTRTDAPPEATYTAYKIKTDD